MTGTSALPGEHLAAIETQTVEILSMISELETEIGRVVPGLERPVPELSTLEGSLSLDMLVNQLVAASGGTVVDLELAQAMMRHEAVRQIAETRRQVYQTAVAAAQWERTKAQFGL